MSDLSTNQSVKALKVTHTTKYGKSPTGLHLHSAATNCQWKGCVIFYAGSLMAVSKCHQALNTT